MPAGQQTESQRFSDDDAADFVRRFEEFWAAPSRERLAAVLAAEVLIVIPMSPTADTLEEGWRGFAELLELMPGLTGTVQRWGATHDGVLIEFTMSGAAGGKPISWVAVDRFTIGDDGLATEHITYFDSAAIVSTVARRPRAWPSFALSQLRRARG
jgi:hypothetical protein